MNCKNQAILSFLLNQYNSYVVYTFTVVTVATCTGRIEKRPLEIASRISQGSMGNRIPNEPHGPSVIRS